MVSMYPPKNKTKKKLVPETNLKKCMVCNKEKGMRNFFLSRNPLHSDGRMPMCKDCVGDICIDKETHEIDLEKLKSLLRQLDKPFLNEVWDMSLKQNYKTYPLGSPLTDEGQRALIGIYFKNINGLIQYKNLSWADGEEKNSKREFKENNEPLTIVTGPRKSVNGYKETPYYFQDTGFEVTDEIIKLFGEGYTFKEYECMQNIYDNMKTEYPNITSSQNSILVRYVRLAMKEEIATSKGQIADAEKWSKMANDALRQLNSIDQQGGITCFSEFFQKLEKAKDVAPILPQFKYRPNDAPDFIIWCYVNYCRRLEGKEEVDYADIYRFYDDKKDQWIKQYGDPYGIFTGDTTEINRDKIKDFIQLPSDVIQNDDEDVSPVELGSGDQ